MGDDFDKFNNTARFTAVIGMLTTLALGGGVIWAIVHVFGK